MLPKPQETIKFDVEGSEAVSTVLLKLINDFPGKTERIAFSSLSETSGISLFPTAGSAVLYEETDICGHVTQICQYPFSVVYRCSPSTEQMRIKIKEFLDLLGKWLEKQNVIVDGKTYKLEEYPALLAGNRIIQSISRTNVAHLAAAYQDGTEDWSFSATLKYKNEYDE